MLLIPCPLCGPRDEIEFTCGGEFGLKRPEPATCASDQQWGDHLYLRTNPRGIHREMWHHVFGCRRWFVVDRDTVTHLILATYRMGDPMPMLERADLSNSRDMPG